MNKNLNNNSIYQKISSIQNNISDIKKDGLNRFQNYKFFNKEQVLRSLKPLLEEYKVALIISDSELVAEYLKDEKEYSVKFLKVIKLIDLENTDSQLNLNFWALGSNTELAKAKGSADSYAMKNFLAEIFLMLVE
ncbi:MAG: hypothetical protein AM1032_000316 [Mycoplasmataceae bacterium]|nr:MAG: hypothetical protein AM1032_000316 [Mycoplasmataceae bacterium]